MVFGGVFERHPDLRLVLTEVQESWWGPAMREMDTAYLNSFGTFRELLSKKPSEYCAANVFVGASFMAAFEAEDAVAGGYSENVMWGSDYPHPEGCWKYPEADDEESTTRLHLRHTFGGIEPEAARNMLGENAVRLYGLDRAKLAKVAGRIGAPTPAELRQPVDRIPDGWSELPFAVAFKKSDPKASWTG
jgi:predicted TIM-barrel fold metal-dependent hydrolase